MDILEGAHELHKFGRLWKGQIGMESFPRRFNP